MQVQGPEVVGAEADAHVKARRRARRTGYLKMNNICDDGYTHLHRAVRHYGVLQTCGPADHYSKANRSRTWIQQCALSFPEGWDMGPCIFLLVAVRQHVLGRRADGKHSNISDTVDLVEHTDICPVLQSVGNYRKECRVRQSHASLSVRSRIVILPCVRMPGLGNVSTDE